MKSLLISNKSKKGISAIIGYVILVSITISLSILVYNWLSDYVQEDTTPKCPEGITLSIEDYTCSSDEVSLKIKNRGRFSVDGYTLKINDDMEAQQGLYEFEEDILFLDETINGESLKPEELFYKTHDVSYLDLSQITLVEIQPIKIENNNIIFCSDIVTKKVLCNRNILTQRLELYLPFNASGELKDYSENDHSLTNQGAEWVEEGKDYGSFNFNGENSFIEVNKLDVINNQPITFSAWIKWNGWKNEEDTSEISGIWGHSGEVDSNSHLEIRKEGLRLRLGDLEKEGMQNISKNVWTHIAFVYNGISAKLYLNGVEIDSIEGTTGSILGGEEHSIGDSHWGIEESNRPFNGLIDDVRIYERALSSDEIHQLYSWLR